MDLDNLSFDNPNDIPEMPGKEIYKTRGKRNFNNWVDAYMEYVDFTEPPRVFCKLTALWAIGAVARRQIWVDNGIGSQWTPNMYYLLIGPPGIARKSSSLKLASDLVEATGLDLGPSQASWEALFELVSKKRESCPVPGNSSYQSSPISFALDEVNTLIDFSNPVMSSYMTQFYDSPYNRIARLTRSKGSEVVFAPCMNMIGCTTNTFIAEHVTEFARGGGLMSRMLVAYGDKKYQIVANPRKHRKYEQCVKMSKALTEDLDYIGSKLRGGYTLSPEAEKFNEDWYIEQELKNEDAVRNGTAEELGFAAREQMKMCKIALLFAVAEHDAPIIELHHIQQANELINSLRAAMVALMHKKPESEALMYEHDLYSYLAQVDQASKVEIFRAMLGKIPTDKLIQILDNNLKLNIIIAKTVRSGVVYMMDPTLKERVKKTILTNSRQ